MAYPIAKRIVPPVIKFWLKKMNGLSNIPKNKPFIIAANHSSYMDHLIISVIIVPYINKKIHFLAKKEHFDNFFEALWHRYAGAIPLDRQKKSKQALQQATNALKKGKVIAIYPEGTRTLNGRMQKAKTGVARLAIAAKVPVVPIGLVNTFEILPKGKYVPRCKRAVMNIGKPIYFDEYYSKKLTKILLREVTTKIMKQIATLSNQKYDF